jgi:hypothetical protein
VIASDVSITVGGRITAQGGAGNVGSGDCVYWFSGSGGGGAIRLVAPVIRGAGHLQVYGGPQINTCRSDITGPRTSGENGRIRLEAFSHEFTGELGGNWTKASPLATFAPAAGAASIRVTHLLTASGLLEVRENPTGSFEMPDVTIPASNPPVPPPTVATVKIRAENVPVTSATRVELRLTSLEGADKTIVCPSTTPPVCAGLTPPDTNGVSTTEVEVAFPTGFTRGYVRATW